MDRGALRLLQRLEIKGSAAANLPRVRRRRSPQLDLRAALSAVSLRTVRWTATRLLHAERTFRWPLLERALRTEPRRA